MAVPQFIIRGEQLFLAASAMVLKAAPDGGQGENEGKWTRPAVKEKNHAKA